MEAPAGTLIYELERRHFVDVSNSRQRVWYLCRVWFGVGVRERKLKRGSEGETPQAWERFGIPLTSSLILGSCSVR